MVKTRAKDTSLILSEAIVRGIQNKKGLEIVCINLGKIHSAVCDYFVICHGTSSTHASAIVDGVTEEVKKHLGVYPRRIEGLSNAEWILLDYLDVVVHIFQEPVREFYQIESLWADAPVVRTS